MAMSPVLLLQQVPWLPAGAGGDRGKPVSAPGAPRAGGHVTGAAPAAGAPGCRRRLAVIEGIR
ncbi:hypothetical protein [Aeromonas caviae]|uniref:hypothetical protein n=1 Tax=Aeromonas caviae TaxID=648 RepID=UPI001CC3C0FE|nr:hypothetical protein [Aeromonas caviae]